MPKVSWHFQGNGYVKIKSSKGKKKDREVREELKVGKKGEQEKQQRKWGWEMKRRKAPPMNFPWQWLLLSAGLCMGLWALHANWLGPAVAFTCPPVPHGSQKNMTENVKRGISAPEKYQTIEHSCLWHSSFIRWWWALWCMEKGCREVVRMVKGK